MLNYNEINKIKKVVYSNDYSHHQSSIFTLDIQTKLELHERKKEENKM